MVLLTVLMIPFSDSKDRRIKPSTAETDLIRIFDMDIVPES
jgi:hypothetical protein